MSYEPSLSDFHESFVRALTRHERVIRAYIRGAGITRPEDVDEIMQEVSLAAWKKFDQLVDVEEFPVWACVIARYEILMFRRRHARDRLVFSERVYELLADQSLEQVESGAKEKRLNHLQQCVEKLPPASRELILAAYQPGSTIDLLATELGKSANNIYQQLWRIRRSLEQCIDEALQKETT